jgi:hypothetical protein
MHESPEYLKMKDAYLRGLAKSAELAHAATSKPVQRNNAQVGAPAVIGGKKVKHVFIEATFPELKGGQMYQHAHGEASGTKPAIARAFKNLLKTIPKKRISVISAKISITTKIVEG